MLFRIEAEISGKLRWCRVNILRDFSKDCTEAMAIKEIREMYFILPTTSEKVVEIIITEIDEIHSRRRN